MSLSRRHLSSDYGGSRHTSSNSLLADLRKGTSSLLEFVEFGLFHKVISLAKCL